MTDVVYDGKKMSLEEAMDHYEKENAGKGWEEESQHPGPNDVVFTQYLRGSKEFKPGQQRQVWIGVTPELKAVADSLMAAGYQFECEELTSGKVHLDCCNADYVLANAVVDNGSPVPRAVADIIVRAQAALANECKPL